MATELNKDKDLEIPGILPEVKGDFHIITAKWNEEITGTLRDGAKDVLLKGGVKNENIKQWTVPGTVELVNAAAIALNDLNTEAVIVIGCVIRGDTPHFDYVCDIVAKGVSHLNAKGMAPVIFGVLTVDNFSQARERAGGILGNKGAEAAAAAIEMVNLHIQMYN